MKLKAGPEIHKLLKLAYQANTPAILEGPHGVGKSELALQAARDLGIQCIVFDLSVMEPPDLIGLPFQKNERTVYAPPNILPTAGHGFLVLEELNRSEKYMRSPCLQLLTARRLNDYALPPGWLPIAAINPDNSGYDVQPLDPALLSRFIRVQVAADVPTWLEWAQDNGVHEVVRQYVGEVPKVFDSAPPRSWTYASRIVSAYESAKEDERSRILLAAIEGLVGPVHAQALFKIYRTGTTVAIDAERILKKYPAVQATIVGWAKTMKTDLLASHAHKMRVALQKSDLCAEIARSKKMARNLQDFAKDLPADLGRDVLASAEQGGAL